MARMSGKRGESIVARLVIAAAVSLMVVSSCEKNAKLKIGSILFDGTNEWFVEAIAGMRDAAKEFDVMLVEADSHYDVSVERDLVKEMLKDDVKSIVICPLSVEESGRSLRLASEVDVPVVTWNSVVQPRPAVQVIVDSTELGRATALCLCRFVEENGLSDVRAGLVIDDSFSIGKERCDGFRDGLKTLVDAGKLRIVRQIRGNLYEQASVSVVKMLSEHPDINFVWCWNQMSLMAAVDVIKRLGRDEIIVAGTDMSMSLAEEMRGGGNLLFVTTQQPYMLGYEAVRNAVRAAKGESIEPTVVIPTLTYTRDDSEGLDGYMKSHARFVDK